MMLKSNRGCLFVLDATLLTDIRLFVKHTYDFSESLRDILFTPGFSSSILSLGYPRSLAMGVVLSILSVLKSSKKENKFLESQIRFSNKITKLTPWFGTESTHSKPSFSQRSSTIHQQRPPLHPERTVQQSHRKGENCTFKRVHLRRIPKMKNLHRRNNAEAALHTVQEDHGEEIRQ